MENLSQTPVSLIERFNVWLKESVMIKLFSIGFLILILLLPTSWIQSLIHERQSRASQALKEVADKWSAAQTLSGPILVIPYKKQDVIDRGKDGVEIRERIEKAFFLPEDLTVTGKVEPLILHRGIFEAAVYESKLNCTSTFSKPDFKKLNIQEDMVIWSDAIVIFGITDLRGISDNPVLVASKDELISEPANNIGITIKSKTGSYFNDVYNQEYVTETVSTTGIVAKLNWENEDMFNGNLSLKLNLKGSRRLDFVPAGKTTSVTVSGPWTDPSFDGEFLPATREITEKGFTASWKVLHFNRPFSQQWTNENQTLSGADFGVKLLIPVDQYQKSTRSSKYSILIILLTFIALFLVEITQKIRIHPFQYILIGVALTIYYTLLLSFSEHFGYNTAYLIASLATVILISLYSSTFIPSVRLVILFAFLLLVFYTFIFVIILQQDFSLLLGSIGLFIIISAVMYFSRKISWYGPSPLANKELIK